jgi:hypothetical protein
MIRKTIEIVASGEADTLNDIGVGSIQLLMALLDVKRDNNRY